MILKFLAKYPDVAKVEFDPSYDECDIYLYYEHGHEGMTSAMSVREFKGQRHEDILDLDEECRRLGIAFSIIRKDVRL